MRITFHETNKYKITYSVFSEGHVKHNGTTICQTIRGTRNTCLRDMWICVGAKHDHLLDWGQKEMIS